MYCVVELELSQSHPGDHSMLGYLRPETVTGLTLVEVEVYLPVLVVPLTGEVELYLGAVGFGIP